jgi:cytochrome c
MTRRLVDLPLPACGERETPALSPRATNRTLSVAVVAFLAFAPSRALASGDAERGAHVYEGCQDCHSLDQNDVGPRHRGVFGRKAGSLPDFDYSPALKNAGFVWDEQTLDKWLTDPQSFRPGVRMFYHLADPKDRADVIAFLRESAK